VTFGYMAAVWLFALDRHADRLRELRPRILLAQFGGAAGTLASLGNGEESIRRPFRVGPRPSKRAAGDQSRTYRVG
jgi:adenylosuccinate lyase